MTFSIRKDDLSGAQVHALLEEHLDGMRQHSPPESIHALDLDALRRPGITFWTAWQGDELMGCGALKHLDAVHAELKSMRTRAGHLRKGAARAMLDHILAEARALGYRRVSLETGSMEAFEPARQLYLRAGFACCEPFDAYEPDHNSVFMTRML